jgi:hypothetical protein
MEEQCLLCRPSDAAMRNNALYAVSAGKIRGKCYWTEFKSQCLRIKLGYSFPGGIKFSNLALRVGRVSKLRE